MDLSPPEPPRRPSGSSHRRAVARLGLIVLITSVFLAGILTGEVVGPGSTDASSSISDQPGFGTLQQVWDLIHDKFADPSAVDDEALLYGAAHGMVASLGDTGHSTFLDPDEATAFRAALSGELVGLGISIEYQDGEPVIVAPIKDSPAEEAGLLPGDVIVEIDGIPTLGMTDAEVTMHLRGDAGTPVTLTIERDGVSDLLQITVVRALIDLDPVTWAMLPNGVALVQLHEFSADSGKQLNEALKEVVAGGATGIVLDLRNNPGGLVSEALTVASQFMPEGTTVYIQKDRDGDESPVDTIGNDGAALDVPLVVLVNRASASAAEMIAGSLRDNGRAEVIGERTYGTGTVVSTFSLDGGSALALGTSFWLTPDGDLAWKVGVAPDVEIRQTDPDAIIDIIDGETVSQTQLDASGDTQLLGALAALRDEETPRC
ncbi:MAG TPA: S41 family peptidase [Thermomicrobiales bacterium]|nr:S41 family peptidase [Thermomicrobiales bacterium]